MDAYKVKLSSGKEVMLRQIRIKDQELAAKAASRGNDDSKYGMAISMQKELVKILLVQINGKALKAIEKEDLDSIFTYAEYMQLVEVLGKITEVGDSGLGNAQIEIVTSGSTSPGSVDTQV
jgi:hypothetical protein